MLGFCDTPSPKANVLVYSGKWIAMQNGETANTE